MLRKKTTHQNFNHSVSFENVDGNKTGNEIISVISLLCYLINGTQNYCPEDDILNIPSHSDKSSWSGWHCRRHSMSYKGTLDNLNLLISKQLKMQINHMGCI